MGGVALLRAMKLRYFGLIIDEKRDIYEDINQHIRMGVTKMEEYFWSIV